MTSGLLETLSQRGVPPVPDTLNESVHQRLNRALLAAHLLDFALGAIPDLTAGLLRAIGHLMGATITGRFEEVRAERPSDTP
jgi:hypothetical protein